MLKFSVPIGLVLALAASAAAQPLAVTTTELPPATFNVTYSVPLLAAGGTPPYSWCGPRPASCPWSPDIPSPLEGQLPPGISVSVDGVVSGIPQAGGSSSFQVQVQDATGATATSSFFTISVTCQCHLLIATTSLPTGLLGQPYNADLGAAGGTPPYSHDPNFDFDGGAGWIILDTNRAPGSPTDQGADLGAMPPPGLTLDLGGRLSGTPVQTGTFGLSVQLTDSSTPPEVATAVVSLAVITVDQATLRDGLLFQNTSLPWATVGEAYQQTLLTNASDPSLVVYQLGGNEPLVPSGSLPPGLTLSSEGVLSGVPSVAGRFTFTVLASDDGVLAADQEFALPVVPAPGGGGCSSIPSGTSGASVVVVLVLAAMSLRRFRRRML